MSLPDDYQVEKVSSALAEIKIYIAWDFDGVDELFVWLQNSVDGTVHYQELGDFTVTTDSDGGGVFILVENNQGVSVDVSVARTTPKTQNYDLSNGEALNPEALIATLDKTVKMIQEEAKGYDNQNITSVNPYVVPDKVERAGKISIFDENGDPDFDTPDNILAPQIGYAEEWATKAEDSLVSVAAGGNGTTDYSSLHHAAKAADSASAASTSEGNAATSASNAETSKNNAQNAESGAVAAQVAAEDALDDLVGVYRHKYISAKEMTAQVTNGATAGVSETGTGNVMNNYFDFTTGVDSFVQFSMSMPDEWDTTSNVGYKFHWSDGAVTGTGNVIWGLSVMPVSNGETIDFSFPSPSDVFSPFQGADLVTTSLRLVVSVANTPALEDLLYFQISRLGTNGLDNYTQNARLLGISIQYKELETKVIEWS